jgi:hypothetical protein
MHRIARIAGLALIGVVVALQAPSTFYQLDVPLAGFAAGEHLIEVKAKGAGGEAPELVPLKITR